MKKILAIAAVAALTAGVSAYAANPFSDVSTNDWAYQAVADLSDQGVVIGYPDGTFRGERNITRYELAQIVARMMAREDQLNAEQRATLEKLAGEYADELANLGVRVSKLEKKVGNLSWSGDARMHWGQSHKADGKAEDVYKGRMRIKAKAQVNDSTYVQGRFKGQFNFKDAGAANVVMDQIFVHHQFGDNFGVTLGRAPLTLGQTGIFYDDTFDGVQATMGTKEVTLEAGYGRMKGWNETEGLFGEPGVDDNGKAVWKYSNPEAWYARLSGNAGPVALSAEYIDVAHAEANEATYWGAGMTVGLGDKADIFGDYYKNTEKEGKPYLWTAGLGFGQANMKKPGSFRVAGQYIKAEKGAFLGGTTYMVDAFGVLSKKDAKATEVKYWLASADVVLAKNVRLHGEYAFDIDAKGDKTDYDNIASVGLNYVF